MSFNLRRKQGYFLIQVYIPCALIVVLSWVSFWLNREATGDRVSLGNYKKEFMNERISITKNKIEKGITTVLTLSTLALDTRTDLPKVHYPTALDWFIIITFLYCIAALIQVCERKSFFRYPSNIDLFFFLPSHTVLSGSLFHKGKQWLRCSSDSYIDVCYTQIKEKFYILLFLSSYFCRQTIFHFLWHHLRSEVGKTTKHKRSAFCIENWWKCAELRSRNSRPEKELEISMNGKNWELNCQKYIRNPLMDFIHQTAHLLLARIK